MKAVRMHGRGGREVLVYEDAPDPAPGPGEVLVAVRACALNHLDIWVRKGVAGPDVSLPHIPGADAAGDVVALGAGVSGPPPGTPVIINPGISCGTCRQCLSGWDNLCPRYRILGAGPKGGYAQLVVVPAANVVPKPAPLSYEEAAAMPLVFLTAWHMLVGLAKLRPGERVLIWGAGSGVGSAAIQIARLLGAHIIATGGSDEKGQKALELGAHHFINHAREDVLQRVKELTDRQGVQVVFDHVGAATWGTSLRALSPRGRLVTCGATAGAEASTDLRYVFARQLQIFGSYMGSKGELLELLPFVEAGRLKPVIDSVWPLSEAAAAQQKLEERRHFGKLVLVPEGS